VTSLSISTWITGAVLVVISAFFVATGLRGLITKRPFLFSARWLFWLMALCFLPIFILPLQRLLDGRRGPMDTMFLLQPLMFVVILAMFWIQMRGYLVYGITEDSFRNALNHALERLSLAHEESLSRIRLPDLGADLQVSIQSWMGQGQLRIKPSRYAPTLDKIAACMKEYLATAPVQTNMLTPIFYVVMGLLMAGFAVTFFNSMAAFHHMAAVHHL
jgi:hypothetical protein